jgi:tRNA (adenine22-N1)-methyltransferase
MRPALSKRLRSVYECVKPGGAADIGTDHGYLAAALALDGLHDPVIAADAAFLPLRKARAYARSLGLEGKISFRLGDGLSVLHEGEVRTAIIAGLGGESVSEIIRADIAGSLELVLQPISRPDILRRALFEEGFEITSERLTLDNGRIFCTITARAGRMEPLTRAQELVGVKTAGDPLFIDYLGWVIRFTEKAAAGASRSGSRNAEYLQDTLASLYRLKGETQK